MAVWGIDIGHTALKAVKLRSTKDGLEISEVARVPINSDEGEENRSESVREALKSFLSEHQVRNDRVFVARSDLNAFSRFIKLPQVDSKGVDKMITYEAQQQIPFPIDEVMWGYHKIERDYEPDEELEVGIFATKKELIQGFLLHLKECGLNPDGVTIAPLATYNYVRFNKELRSATVVLDIGAKHTDLIVMRGENFWIRNLRIAGGDITEALAESFKIPHAQAEKLKLDQSKNADKIARKIQHVLKDFAGEIHRSISFFKSQAEDLEIKRMLLVGDGAKLKNLSTFFQKELGFKVQRFKSFDRDKFFFLNEEDQDVVGRHIMAFSVAFGLALQGLGHGKTNLNLLPTEDQLVGELRRKLPLAIATAVVCWLAVGVSTARWSSVNRRLQGILKKSDSADKLDKADAGARQKQDISNYETRAQPYRDMLAGRVLPIKIMNRLGKILPRANAELVTLSPEERMDKSYTDQLDLVKNRRQAEKFDVKKLWLLKARINSVKGAKRVNADGSAAAPDTRQGYRTELVIARRCAKGKELEIFNLIQDDLKAKLLSEFSDGPFWIRKPDTDRADPAQGEMTFAEAANKVIYALDLQATSPELAGDEPFRCFVMSVRFDVGFEPPATAEPEDGN
jgi:type IV pilus assembly protein PilM